MEESQGHLKRFSCTTEERLAVNLSASGPHHSRAQFDLNTPAVFMTSNGV